MTFFDVVKVQENEPEGLAVTLVDIEEVMDVDAVMLPLVDTVPLTV